MMNIKQSIMVRPTEETPKGRLWLSSLDTIVRTPNSHTRSFLIYESGTSFETNTLIKALSKVLVQFYPLAGRLNMNANTDRYEIDCNGEGVLFVEAETASTIADLGEIITPSFELERLLTPSWDYDLKLSSTPLEMLQLTRFSCGGVALGFASHHHAADGNSYLHFNLSLCRVARGLDLLLPPNHDRKLHLAPREPPQIKFAHSEFDPLVPSFPSKGLSAQSETKQALFDFSKEQINTLKQEVASQLMKHKNTRTSTYEVLAALVWRSACKARALDDDLEVKLYIPVDARLKLKEKPFPKGYFGNVLFFSVCSIKASDVMNKPLWYIVDKIQDAKKKMDDEEYLRSAIDHLESKSGLPSPIMGSSKFMFPNLMINSWARLPFNEMDFGLGPPKVYGNCAVKLEGLSFLVPSQSGNEGSLSLAINLFAAHMSSFEKHLYENLQHALVQ